MNTLKQLENFKTIRDFLTKMAKQDNRATAAPYFYVIRTEVEEVGIDPDNAETVRYYDSENIEDTYDSKDEAREILKKDGYSAREIDLVIDRLEKYGIRKRWEHRGMFLTEEEAEQHLKLNYYHYSDNAHTYVDHAWRAPELKKFFEALFEEYHVDKQNWG